MIGARGPPVPPSDTLRLDFLLKQRPTPDALQQKNIIRGAAPQLCVASVLCYRILLAGAVVGALSRGGGARAGVISQVLSRLPVPPALAFCAGGLSCPLVPPALYASVCGRAWRGAGPDVPQCAFFPRFVPVQPRTCARVPRERRLCGTHHTCVYMNTLLTHTRSHT